MVVAMADSVRAMKCVRGEQLHTDAIYRLREGRISSISMSGQLLLANRFSL